MANGSSQSPKSKEIIRNVILAVINTVLNDPSIPIKTRTSLMASMPVINMYINQFLNSLSDSQADELLARLRVLIENIYNQLTRYE